MKLTILGNCGPWPKAGGACSGYLLEAGGTNLLFDCGCGVLAKLQQECAIPDLDGVILSHLHSDHMGDMMVLRYALPYYLAKGAMGGRLPVWLPGKPEGVFETIASEEGFDARAVTRGDAVHLGDLVLEFFPVRHLVPCNAVKASCGGKAFVYSGDMNTTPGFAAFAAGADLLLIDGCLPQADWDEGKPHLSAALAAGVGLEAKAKRTVLTHIRPVDNEHELLAEARQAHPGAEIAREGASYEL